MPAPKQEQDDFSDSEKAFFDSAPTGGYDGYVAPPDAQPQSKGEERFDHDTEMFHTSEPTTEYAFIDDNMSAEEEARLEEARALLAREDAPTEEMEPSNVVPLRQPEASEKGFGSLADKFFKEGDEKYGADAADEGPNGDGGEPVAANNTDEFEDLRKTG